MFRLFIILFLIFSFSAQAQIQLGLKISPSIANNRVSNDLKNISQDGASIKMILGFILEKPFSESYLLSTGLNYVGHQAIFKFDATSSQEEYRLQYLQIPVCLKLLTNEMFPKTKIYFQVGMGINFKIFEEATQPAYTTIEKFNPIDFVGIIGTGVEYRISSKTVLMGGISYQRGLLNTVNSTSTETNNLSIKNNILSLDIGIKL